MTNYCCEAMKKACEWKFIDTRIGLPTGSKNPADLQVIGYSIGHAQKKIGALPIFLNVCPFCATKLNEEA